MSNSSAHYARYADSELDLIRTLAAGLQQAVRDGSYVAALGDLQTLREVIDRAEDDVALAARLNGASWADLGDGLGLTRQAAFARYNRRLK